MRDKCTYVLNEEHLQSMRISQSTITAVSFGDYTVLKSNVTVQNVNFRIGTNALPVCR